MKNDVLMTQSFLIIIRQFTTDLIMNVWNGKYVDVEFDATQDIDRWERGW